MLNVKTIIDRFRHVAGYGLILATFFRWLLGCGLTILPYRLVLESGCRMAEAGWTRPDAQDLEALRVDEGRFDLLGELAQDFERKNEFSQLWAKRCVCFCLRRSGSAVACGWYSLERCLYAYLPFHLQDDEAYLFNFRTLRRERGRDYAVYLRLLMIEHLVNVGRTAIYSIAEIFNTPAMRFMKKVVTQPVCSFVYVDFFGLWRKNIEVGRKLRQEGLCKNRRIPPS